MDSFELLVGRKLMRRLDDINDSSGMSSVVRSIIEVGEETENGAFIAEGMLREIYNYKIREIDFRGWLRMLASVDDNVFQSKIEAVSNVQ